MDQIVTVLTGIIANGLTSIIAQLGRKTGRLIIGQQLINKIKLDESSLRPILQKSMDEVAGEIEWKGLPSIEEICLFLTSPEVEAIVRQIYAAKLSVTKADKNLDLIQKEFLTSISLHFDLPDEEINKLSKTLLDKLVEGCENNLQLAIDSGVLSAHEAKSALRHSIILNELDSIKKNLDFLTSIDKADIKEFLDFEKKYREEVGNRHSYITPPHFDAFRKIAIDDLYVSSDFITTPSKKNDPPVRLNMKDYLSTVYRAVVLGNPGGGKSTFTQKLCHDLSKNYSQRFFSGRQVTPILVILREYGAEKKEYKRSILQFIEVTANSRYQVQPPKGAFEYLLRNGRVLVIFDGLDELLDTSYRREISGDVESFCRFYPSVPVLVTSREVGYEQAPLDEKMFEISRISDFTEGQVREYAKKWFAVDLDLAREQQKQKAEAFYEESRIVPDLRSNPLMLALMCNIYRGENYIPRNRPDVYEKCATMLFERWDKSRGIHVTLPFEAHIKPAMMYLAYWIYSDESLQGGVTEKTLIAKAADYLYPIRFEDRDEAEMAAKEFIDFCRGRAWVFTDTGTTKEGERLYQFTHRTFLEYFTAYHLVRTNPTPDELGEVLLPKIVKQEWDVVAQLAFQLQNKNVEGAGDALFTLLINETRNNKQKGMYPLSFIVRCLEFMVPSPKITRNITTIFVDQVVALRLRKTSRIRPAISKPLRRSAVGEYFREVMGDLLNSAHENRSTIADCLEKLIIERTNSSSEMESKLYLELSISLSVALYAGRRIHNPQKEIIEFWRSVTRKITNKCQDKIMVLNQNDRNICHLSYFNNIVTLKNFIKWHGVRSIFEGSQTNVYDIYFAPIAWSLLRIVLFVPYYSNEKERIEKSIVMIQGKFEKQGL
jgi:hypothetical protein